MNSTHRAIARANRRLASLQAEATSARSREALLLRCEIEGLRKRAADALESRPSP